VVEILTGLVFLLIFSAQGGLAAGWNFINLVFLFYIASALIIIFIYDIKHYEIPDKVLFPAIGITLLFQIVNYKFLILNYLLAVLVSAGFFFVIFWVSKGRWMGFGDVKLAVLMGLLLGWPDILTALFLAFFLGAIIGVILILFKKKGLKSEMPFGPFLVLGIFLAQFFGSNIIQWYLNLFQI
jgi:prepilin signal peptidase PulO-like enzyme (type II secretory pathway)